jgi:putative SOS response-associated peptidase YedK
MVTGMCGRYFRHTPREELAAAFRAELGSSLEPAYNVAPGQAVLAVRFHEKTGERTLDDLRWGLVPFFAKDAKVAWKTINARAETVDTAASYRNAFLKRRCLIVADGFFEWKAEGKTKTPYAIALASGKPFALAGLWEAWRDPASGAWLRSCAIVTTEANATVGQIHDRMPVILDEQDHARWLGEVSAQAGELKELLAPYRGELVMWPVSARMNKGDVEGPEVIERVEPEQDPARRKPAHGKSGKGGQGELF